MKKKILTVAAAGVLLLAAACGIYINDYYHAAESALQVSANNAADYSCREGDETLVFLPKGEDGTVKDCSGSADAGMGIYSAAKLYDLDFIPICIEEYDLIIPDHAWDTPQVQQMLQTLKSDEFREKILALGGYTVDAPGEIIPID